MLFIAPSLDFQTDRPYGDDMYIASRRTIITFLLLIVTISFKIKFKLKSIYLIEMTIILQTAYNNEACIGYVHVY